MLVGLVWFVKQDIRPEVPADRVRRHLLQIPDQHLLSCRVAVEKGLNLRDAGASGQGLDIANAKAWEMTSSHASCIRSTLGMAYAR